MVEIEFNNENSAKSTSSTPFDDALRSMLEIEPKLFIPLINEAFHTNYKLEETVVQFKNEHVIAGQKVITDSLLYVGEIIAGGCSYHIECQSS